MQIKKFFDYPLLKGKNQYVSGVIGYNGINEDQILTNLPDLNNCYDIEKYLYLMSPLKEGNNFLEYIKNNKNKKYCVIGDYDCDGIMATTIMSYALTLCGIETTYTCPNRFTTGYGMKKYHVDVAIKNGANTIITVDNGITANDAIDYAHEKGLDVIVTDHHTPQEKSHADICIDPLYNDDECQIISGATVAMKLAYLLYQEFFNDKTDIMNNFVALAGITVFSDVMPMLSENRILISAVIPFLEQQKNIAGSFINRLSHLLDFYPMKSKTDAYLNLDNTFRTFNKDNIDFYFVPIINATNRVLGDVEDLVYDIMSLFVQDYDGIPHLYSDTNKKRKFMRSELNRMHKKDDTTHAVVEALTPSIYDDNYAGIVGLVASDVVEKENKPALIGINLQNGDKDIHFSGRSVSGYNLYEALQKIKEAHPELRFTFGGHAEALGAACHLDDIPLLQKYLSDDFASATLSDTSIEPTYFTIDNFSYIKEAYYQLWPFGNKFEFPKFYVESHINYLYKSDREFTVKDLTQNGFGIHIKYFDKATGDKIADFAFKHRDKLMKFIVSLMEDENNQLVLKIEKFIN